MAEYDLPQIYELLSTEPGKSCWIQNLTNEPIEIGERMDDIPPGERLYLGSQQRVRAATKLSRDVMQGVLGKEWVNVRAQNFARIVILLQILNRNGCPLIDPETGEKIVIEDDAEFAAWEKLAHLHNKKFDPYKDLPSTLAAYLTAKQALTPASSNVAYLPSAPRLIDDASISKYAQSSIGENEEGVKLLQYLIALDLRSRGVSSVEEYAAILISEQERISVEEAKRTAKNAALLSGLNTILLESRLPGRLDETMFYLAFTLRTLEGLSFGGNTVELLRYCGLLNGDSANQRR